MGRRYPGLKFLRTGSLCELEEASSTGTGIFSLLTTQQPAQLSAFSLGTTSRFPRLRQLLVASSHLQQVTPAFYHYGMSKAWGNAVIKS